MNPKVLLVAYQCGAGMGSVSQIGWEWFERLRQHQPVTLVTHVRNRPAIDAALSASAEDPARAEIIYIDTEWFAGPLYRLASRLFPKSQHSVFLVTSLDYFLFDFMACRRLKRDAQAGRWDVLHRVTPVTTAAPTRLARLRLPTVVGPLNCGLKDPDGFATVMRQEATWLLHVRKLTRLFDALIGSTRRADRILVASKSTLAAIGASCRHLCQPMLENGVELSRFKATPWPKAPDAATPLRVLFVGRLVPVKCLDLLIRALRQAHDAGVNLTLDVVGDGPMGPEWQDLCTRLGMTAQVRFHGAASAEQVAEHMRQCHVLCLPSVRESGGAVLLEAMACARPVIALDFGGPGEIVTPDVGVLIRPESPAHVIDELARLLAHVPQHPNSWRARGIAARQRVEQRYSWNSKIDEARRLYAELMHKRSHSAC